MEKTPIEILRKLKRKNRKLKKEGMDETVLQKLKHKILVLKRLIRSNEEKARSKK